MSTILSAVIVFTFGFGLGLFFGVTLGSGAK